MWHKNAAAIKELNYNKQLKSLTQRPSWHSGMGAQQSPGQGLVRVMCAQPVLCPVCEKCRADTCYRPVNACCPFWKPPVLPAGAADSWMLMSRKSMGIAPPKLFSCARYGVQRLCLPLTCSWPLPDS